MNKNKTYIVVFLIFAFILGLVTFGEQMFHSTMVLFRSDQKEEVVLEEELINRDERNVSKKKEESGRKKKEEAERKKKEEEIKSTKVKKGQTNE